MGVEMTEITYVFIYFLLYIIRIALVIAGLSCTFSGYYGLVDSFNGKYRDKKWWQLIPLVSVVFLCMGFLAVYQALDSIYEGSGLFNMALACGIIIIFLALLHTIKNVKGAS